MTELADYDVTVRLRHTDTREVRQICVRLPAGGEDAAEQVGIDISVSVAEATDYVWDVADLDHDERVSVRLVDGDVPADLVVVPVVDDTDALYIGPAPDGRVNGHDHDNG